MTHHDSNNIHNKKDMEKFINSAIAKSIMNKVRKENFDTEKFDAFGFIVSLNGIIHVTLPVGKN